MSDNQAGNVHFLRDKTFHGVECNDCGATFEKVPTVSAGDESWWVCPECQTVEGKWNEVTTDEDGKVISRP